jgi:hypothetical protein
MTNYDDVETILDLFTLYYSQDLDAEGIEHAIREEYEVINGDLLAYIQNAVGFSKENDITPASLRAELALSPWQLAVKAWAYGYLPQGVVGLLAGSASAFLFSRHVQDLLPPALWSLRYVLLVLGALGVHLALRHIQRRYLISTARLAKGFISVAVGAFALGTVLFLRT